MDALVGFIAWITCAVEAVLLCISRNKQIYIMTIDYIFHPEKYLGLENFSKTFFQKLLFQERTDNMYKSKICVDAPWCCHGHTSHCSLWIIIQVRYVVRYLRFYNWYTQSNKNLSAWYFVRPAQAVTCGTVANIIRVVLLSPYLCIRGVCLSSIHYNQSHRVYINRSQQCICLIWN